MTHLRSQTMIAMVFAAQGLLLASGCATGRTTEWIHPGQTTRAEILERYGEPDLIRQSADGQLAIYRPITPPPPIDVTVARAGPSGLQIFRTEQVIPGLGAAPIEPAQSRRPLREVTIRYDDQGIVREVYP